MTTARPAKVINIVHTTTRTGIYPDRPTHPNRNKPWRQVEEVSYYAVRQPTDAFGHATGDEPINLEAINNGDDEQYVLFGGLPIYIYSQADIDGLRTLLNAIEEDLTNTKEPAE